MSRLGVVWLFDSFHIFLLADIINLFKQKNFSAQGTSDYSKEQATYKFFKKFLEELEGALWVGVRGIQFIVP